MSADHYPTPDWRSAESYRPLLAADPAVWAWEFGRRAARREGGGEGGAPSMSPGLCFAGPGPQGDRVPAVLWSWRADPSVPVLEVEPARAGEPGVLDLRAVALPALVVRGEDGEQHALVSEGQSRLRLAVVRGDVLSGPVACRYRLPQGELAVASLDGLRQIVALGVTGHLPNGGIRPRAKVSRWVEVLRAYDARQAGASQREIAILLFGQARVREDWSGRSDYMRMRVQRLLRAAEEMVAGRYRALCGLAPATLEPRPVAEIWRSAAWR